MGDVTAVRTVSPQGLDIVVSRDAATGTKWAINRYLGPAALSAASRDRAVQLATALARELSVDAWSFDGDAYTLLLSGRSLRVPTRHRAASLRPGVRS